MKVLLDNCVDVRLVRHLVADEVVHARSMGWKELANGRLLAKAEEQGFGLIVTTDKNMRHQQNLSGRRVSLATLAPLFTTL